MTYELQTYVEDERVSTFVTDDPREASRQFAALVSSVQASPKRTLIQTMAYQTPEFPTLVTDRSFVVNQFTHLGAV